MDETKTGTYSTFTHTYRQPYCLIHFFEFRMLENDYFHRKINIDLFDILIISSYVI